ncbi:MAG TPA: ROK family protein [Firmicutes bacterium]|nr:ROK family protein [Bacillota bacterium]
MDCIVGIDLGGTNIAGAAADIEGNVLTEAVVPTPAGGHEVVLKAIDRLVRKLAGDRKLKALALGVPGVINPEEGLCLASGNLNWTNVPVGSFFRQRYENVPVYLDNDARVAARGEQRFGAAKNCRDFIYVTAGTGIGGGIFTGGMPVTGSRGGGGEIGHMVLLPDGPPCTCGGRGCLETLAAAPALAREGRLEALKDPFSLLHELAAREGAITAAMVSEACDRGDIAANAAFQRCAGWLGIGLAGLINIFNPGKVIIGGGLSLAGDKLLGVVKAKVARHAMREQGRHVEIILSPLRNKAGLYGALALALSGYKQA